MKAKNKQLLVGLLLLLLPHTVMANTYYYNEYVKNYSNCNVTLNEDNSVNVSFNFHLSDNIWPVFDDKDQDIESDHEVALLKLTGFYDAYLSDEPEGYMYISPSHMLLSLYFYQEDGMQDNSIQFNHIEQLTINGKRPSGNYHDLKKIEFFNDERNDGITNFKVSFKIAADVLKHIRIGATVGNEFLQPNVGDKKYSFFASNGVSFSSSGKQCAGFAPQLGHAPDNSLDIDPKFRIDSAIWQLKPLDLDKLRQETASQRGHSHAPFTDSKKAQFCINYRTAGLKNTRYSISASNSNGLAQNNKYFQLKDDNKIINYAVELKNSNAKYVNFTLPRDVKKINLAKNQSKEKMCWSPRIYVSSTETTDKGHYSDTLNFTITPSS